VAPEPKRRLSVQAEIEYQIVALNLTVAQVAAIIMEATGVTVDPQATGFLRALNRTQVDATRKRLAQNAGWKPPRKVY